MAQPQHADYAHDVAAFLASDKAAPVSQDPTRAEWASPEARTQLLNMFESQLGRNQASTEHTELLLYNKSRDTHRICPHCRKVYEAGTSIPRLSEAEEREQQLSGICSTPCFQALNQNM